MADPPARGQRRRRPSAAPEKAPDRQTLISCLYDLPGREHTARQPIAALQEHSRYVLGLGQPMVLFVDPPLADWARRARHEHGLLAETYIVERPLEDLELFAVLPRIRRWRAFANNDPVKDTPLHQILTWSKFDLLLLAIDKNPLDTTHFAWIDLGIAKVARPPRTFPPPNDRVAVLQMKAVALRELDDRTGYYSYERGRTAGGFFRGSGDSLRELAGLFRAELTSALDDRLRPTDQMILSAITAQRPDLFDFSYGDYESILLNWDHIRHDLATVFENLAHCRQESLWEQSLDICRRIEASVAAKALVLTDDEQTQLLDEHYIAAWYGASRDLARSIKTQLEATGRSTGYFARHRPRIEANLALLPATEPPRRPTLCLCMIVRNEAATIERCLGSVRHLIDHWVICDTGSEDDTVDRIRRALDGIPGTLHHRPWVDFGANRSELLALARGAADYLLLLDADMTLLQTGPLPPLGAAAYSLRFDGPLDYGNVRLVQSGRDWRFIGSTHEYLTADEPFDTAELPVLRVVHHADGGCRAHKLERDIELLTRDLDARPDDPRTMFYLAQTQRDLGNVDEAIALYERRASMGAFAEEAFYAAYQAGVLRARQDPAGGIGALLSAWESRPARAEPLYDIALVARRQGWWHVARLAAEQGKNIPRPDDDLFVHRWVYDWGLLLEYSIAAWWLGDATAALHASEQLLAVADLPADVAEHARRNHRIFSGTERADAAGPEAPADPPPVPALRDLAPDTRFAQIHLDVEPVWPQFNPSIAAGRGRGFRMIVRTANYDLGDGQYQMLSAGPIQTLNYLVTLDASLSIKKVRPLVDQEAGPPRHDSTVIGFEDCRLIDHDRRWWATATVRDRNADQRAEVALVGLDGARITSVRPLNAGRGPGHEKNWMPFRTDDGMHLLYSVRPTIVYRVEPDTGEMRLVQDEPAPDGTPELRGGSPGIPFDGGNLFAVHEVAWRGGGRDYTHRLILLGPDFRVAGLSSPFSFLGPGVEYCAGLARHPDGVVFSFGRDDRTAWLAVVSLDTIRRLFDSA